MVIQGDAHNVLGNINRGNPRLKLNKLARELFWFGEEHKVNVVGGVMPREQNSIVDELSKLVIPDDWMLVRSFFRWLEER